MIYKIGYAVTVLGTKPNWFLHKYVTDTSISMKSLNTKPGLSFFIN